MSGNIEYTTSEEMLETLRVAYTDPNEVENKKKEFKKLRIKDTQTFYDFLTVFR
jgi:hypothetical protein